MLHSLTVLLATFWAWETVRYIADTYAPNVFAATRPAHPLAVAAFPVVVFWPDWITGLAVAAGVGILHLLVERFLVKDYPVPVQLPRNRGGLPPLP